MAINTTTTHETVRLVGARISLNKKIMLRLSKIVVANIIKNVEKSNQTDGTAIKENKVTTFERKQSRRQRGKSKLPNLPLIDEEGRFILGSKYMRVAAKNMMTITHKSSSGKLLRWVQEKGYVGWFGLSQKGFESVVGGLRDEIKKAKQKVIREVIKND